MRARFLSTWGTTLMLMFASLISYLDRNTLAVLAPTILSDTHLTAEQYGWVISAFSVAYMVGNPVWGYALDRIGLTLGLSVAVGLWTLASAAHATVTGFAGFAAARGVLGWAEGATFPAGLRGSVESLPPEKRARGMALAYSGGSLGAIVTPFIVTPIALHFGWRSAFWFTGLAGVLWIGFWQLHRRGRSEPQRAQHSPEPLPSVREARFWALVFAYALGAAPIALGIYAAPIYLSRALGLSQGEMGKLLFIPPLGWEVGYFFWAWVADRFARAEPRPVRFLAALTVCSLPLAGITAMPSLALTMSVFFWSMFTAAGFIVLALHYGRLVYPPRHTGLIAGIAAGSWSALVAVIMPIVGWLLDESRYGTAFTFAALLPVAGFAGWWACSRVTASASSVARA